MGKPPGRPKSDDPKVAVTLRLPRSLVAAYQAKGDGWRAVMEARLAGPAVAERLRDVRGAPMVVNSNPAAPKPWSGGHPKPGKAKR